MDSSTDDKRRRLLYWGVLLGALVVAAVVFGQALSYGIIPTWDDGVYVVERAVVQDWWGASWQDRLTTPRIGYPMPLPTFIYAHAQLLLDDHAFAALHALSLALHLLNAVLVFSLVRRWESARLAAIVAAVWVVHPVVVESVVWLTNLKMVLASSCLLGAMLLWQRGLDDNDRGYGSYAAIFALFVLALMCRPDAAILPVVLACQSLTQSNVAASLRARWPLLAVATVISVVYVVFADASHDQVVSSSVFRKHGPMGVVVRVFHALQMAITNFAWPFDLHPAYFQRWDEGLWDALPGMALAAAIIAVVVALWRSGRRRQLFPIVLAAFLYAPFSNIVFLPRFTADTYLYLVSFAGLLAVAVAVDGVVGGSGGERRGRAIGAYALAAVVFAAFAIGSWYQVQRWQSAPKLWQPVAAAQPNTPRPYRHLIWHLVVNERWDEAREMVDRALPVFRASKMIPFYVPTVLRKTGDSALAADLALEALMENASVKDMHHRVLLETLVSENLALPAAPEVLEVVGESVSVYLEHDEWMAQDNVGTGFSGYFLRQGQPELAGPFLEHALGQPDTPCAAWDLLPLIPSSVRQQIEAPPRPSRCTDR